MAVETFGYGSVIELSESVISRLFGGKSFEESRVAPPKNEPSSDPNAKRSSDFVSIAFGGATDPTLHALIGDPIVSFSDPATPSNALRVILPITKLAVETTGAEPTRSNGEMAIAISNLLLTETTAQGVSALKVDGSSLTGDSVRYAVKLVGLDWIVTDSDADFLGYYEAGDAKRKGTIAVEQLANARIDIAARVKALLPAEPIVFDLSSLDATRFDVAAFGEPTAGSFQLRLYQPSSRGSSAIDTRRTIRRNGASSFALTMSPAELEAFVERAIEGAFWTKPETFSVPVPAQPPNFVQPFSPAAGTPIAGRVWSADASGKARLLFAAGTFTKRTHGDVHNWTRGTSIGFRAADDGSLDTMIDASGNDLLGLTIAERGEGDATLKRPTHQLQTSDGVELSLSFDMYVSDAALATNGSLRFVLEADPSRAFGIRTRVVETHLDGPLALSLVTFFTMSLFEFGIWNIVRLTAGNDFFSDKVRDALESFGGAFSLGSDGVPSTFLALDEIHANADGLFLGGRAEAGRILGAGRTLLGLAETGFTLTTDDPRDPNDQRTPIFLRWDPRVEPFVISTGLSIALVPETSGTEAHATFWSLGPSDVPGPSAFGATSLSLAAGTNQVAFLEGEGLVVKVLFERLLAQGSAPSAGMSITWVTYPRRALAEIDLVDGVVATLVSSSESDVLSTKVYRYEGTISLERTRIFLTDGTRARGEEKWFWNGVELDDTERVFSWGSIALDRDARIVRLRVEPNTDASSPPESLLHRFEASVTDVFGVEAHAHLFVSTVTLAVTPKRIAIRGDRWREPRYGLGDPIRDRKTLVALTANDRLRLRATLEAILVEASPSTDVPAVRRVMREIDRIR
jgi:hypothetical protein